MSAQDFLALGLLSLLVSSAYWLGREIGKHQQRELWRDHMEKCNRYVYAVDDLDKWCGHQSPHARLIARHLRATGEGLSLNAGTPVGDEACQIGGLREQLKRLDAKEKPMTTEPTDAELKAMWQLHAADIGGIFYYARAIEQAHGIKATNPESNK